MKTATSRRVYDLPPLSTLAAFEAAARHLSFKNAAVELNVTPSAVSHQVKALETELGAPLFLRRHRGVELTSEGGRLFSTLAESFYQISRQLRSVRERQGEKRAKIEPATALPAIGSTAMWMLRWSLCEERRSEIHLRDQQELRQVRQPPGHQEERTRSVAKRLNCSDR